MEEPEQLMDFGKYEAIFISLGELTAYSSSTTQIRLKVSVHYPHCPATTVGCCVVGGLTELCCVVLSGAVWCCVMLCDAVWWCVMLYGAVWWVASLCGAVRCSVMGSLTVCGLQLVPDDGFEPNRSFVAFYCKEGVLEATRRKAPMKKDR